MGLITLESKNIKHAKSTKIPSNETAAGLGFLFVSSHIVVGHSFSLFFFWRFRVSFMHRLLTSLKIHMYFWSVQKL
ncbi:hypothetical protein RJT34_00664 [Clitoria ternatea]|uniref:Uncharacterized protein n=1 Tax=Clitoria ternatea TaxID=43366 RepID=A0AAN9KJH5_CLITE